jgi:hypothetical protein
LRDHCDRNRPSVILISMPGIEIAQQAKATSASLGTKLARLEDLGYIERRFPVTPDGPEQRPGYHIEDPFFRFWFRYVAGTSRHRYTLLGSCKWHRLVDTDVLDQLRDHQAALGGHAAAARLIIFGRDQFTPRPPRTSLSRRHPPRLSRTAIPDRMSQL